jgi:hypothetical protein
MATIRAKTNSHFAVLEKEDYVKIVKTLEQNKLTKKVEFLKTLPIFQKWHKDYLNTFSFSFKEKIFGRNHKVIKEGLPSEKLYIVVEGEFLCSKKVVFPSRISEECNLISSCIETKFDNTSIKIQNERFKDHQK